MTKNHSIISDILKNILTVSILQTVQNICTQLGIYIHREGPTNVT